MMKKFFALFLGLSIAMLGYAQPQKLVVKTDTDTSEWRYWALDGKQLPFYSLVTPVSDEGGGRLFWNFRVKV